MHSLTFILVSARLTSLWYRESRRAITSCASAPMLFMRLAQMCASVSQRWTWQRSRRGRCRSRSWSLSLRASWRAGRRTGWGGSFWTGGRNGCRRSCRKLRRSWIWLEWWREICCRWRCVTSVTLGSCCVTRPASKLSRRNKFNIRQ